MKLKKILPDLFTISVSADGLFKKRSRLYLASLILGCVTLVLNLILVLTDSEKEEAAA